MSIRVSPQSVKSGFGTAWPVVQKKVSPANVVATQIVQAQVQEMQMIREKVYQMEQQQLNLKQK